MKKWLPLIITLLFAGWYDCKEFAFAPVAPWTVRMGIGDGE
jgi:hypothetical protein